MEISFVSGLGTGGHGNRKVQVGWMLRQSSGEITRIGGHVREIWENRAVGTLWN